MGSVSLGQFAAGMAFFVPTLGAALAAAGVVTHRRYGYLPLLPRSLAFMVLATAAMVFASVAPAALGVLSRPSVLVAALIVLALALLLPAPAASPAAPDEQARPRPSSVPSIVIAIVTVGAVTVYELARLRVLLTQPLTDIDMLGFHLPGIARFIQSGTLWRVDQFEPGFATAQYPNNGDFLILSAVLPWRSLAFVRLVPVPFYAFTAIGTYALALELRAPRAAAATLAAAIVPVPAMALLALDGLPDVISLATLAAGLVFLIRHSRSGRGAELVLAGLALGLSFGTKWYGSTAVAVVLVVWVATRLLTRTAAARVAREAAALVGMVLLGGGIWLARNLIESGNPIYPKAVSALGVQLFPGSRGDVVDQYGYTIADYLGKPHVLRTYIYPGFKLRVGLLGAVLLVGLAVALLTAVIELRRRRGNGGVVVTLALGIAALGMLAEYTITPGSAYGPVNVPIQAAVNIRWLMPAILVAAALTAAAVPRLGRAGLLLELAALAGALDAIRLGPGVPGSTVVKVTLLLAALSALGLLVARSFRGRGRSAIRRPGAILAAGLAALAALVVLARIDQTRFDRHSYASFDPTFAWIDAHAPSGQRVGIAGVASTTGLSPVLPAFGLRLGNRVSYVGDRVRHSVHLPADQSSFDGELARGHYGLLVIGLQDASHTDAWARAAGYRLAAQSPRLALYVAPGLATR